MKSRSSKLPMWGVLGFLAALVAALVIVYGQVPIRPIAPTPPTPEATGALAWFIERLKPCFPEIFNIREYPKCTFPAGDYCLYYTGDPGKVPPDGRSFHTFGWYSETVGCAALYPIVRGDT